MIDVWDGMEPFERFRDDQIIPTVRAVGLSAPQVQMVEVDDTMPDDGRSPAFVQRVIMPGLDRAAFRTMHEEVLPGGARPDELTFHVNGPANGGWCVIDGWTSKANRDRFMQRTRPIIEKAPLTGPPTVEELSVEATMSGRTAART